MQSPLQQMGILRMIHESKEIFWPAWRQVSATLTEVVSRMVRFGSRFGLGRLPEERRFDPARHGGVESPLFWQPAKAKTGTKTNLLETTSVRVALTCLHAGQKISLDSCIILRMSICCNGDCIDFFSRAGVLQ